MNVDLIFKVAAIGILVAVLNQLLIRSGREEQAMMTTLAGLIVVSMILSLLFTILPLLSEIPSGTTTLILTIVISAAAAILFPIKEENENGA